MGYWLILFILIILGIVVIDNAFDNSHEKFPYFLMLALVSLMAVGWGYHEWRQHLLTKYEVTQDYLVLTYLSGQTEYVVYPDINDIKFFVVGKANSRCGLSFYI